MFRDFMSAVLISKPDDIFEFAEKHFGASTSEAQGVRPLVSYSEAQPCEYEYCCTSCAFVMRVPQIPYRGAHSFTHTLHVYIHRSFRDQAASGKKL